MTTTAMAAAIGARTGPPRKSARSATRTTKPPASATASRWTTPRRSPRFQASEKPKGVANDSASSSTPQVMLKKGAPTVIFSTCSARGRADRACRTARWRRTAEQQVVEHESALARDRRENTALFQDRRAPGEQSERTDDEDGENGENEHAASRIAREGVHGRQDAGPHQEGPQQRQGKGKDGEEDCPHLERVTFLHDRDRMDEGGSGKPWHQRRVLDRVPEPKAAPAQRIVGPVRTHRDAEGEEPPGDQSERPDETRPGRVDAAFDQRRRCERENDREADIAEVQQRRMDREAGILKDRVEILTFERRRDKAGWNGSEVQE